MPRSSITASALGFSPVRRGPCHSTHFVSSPVRSNIAINRHLRSVHSARPCFPSSFIPHCRASRRLSFRCAPIAGSHLARVRLYSTQYGNDQTPESEAETKASAPSTNTRSRFSADKIPYSRPRIRSKPNLDGNSSALQLATISSNHHDELPSLLRDIELGLQDRNISEDDLWELYQRIPTPRAERAPETTKSMLQRFKVVRHGTTRRMLRYLSLISDMSSSGIPVPNTAWPAALHFAGRCVNQISATEIEYTLHLWRQMEEDSNMQSNIVCFNILFDVATKAHKFAVAEVLLREMKRRGIKYNRHFRTSLIYHWGVRGRGDLVRKHYADLVKAGEIVDTAVINCVIGALLSCGEPTSAEYIFLSAKSLHESNPKSRQPPRHWYAKRKVGHKLELATRKLREIDDLDVTLKSKQAAKVDKLRQTTAVSPDATTYRLLIHHYAVFAGDIDRVASLIDEMEQYKIPIEGNIFLWLFFSFAKHGGTFFTDWSRERLERTWTAFLTAVDNSLATQENQETQSAHSARDSTQNSSEGGSIPFFAHSGRVREREQRQPSLLSRSDAKSNYRSFNPNDPEDSLILDEEALDREIDAETETNEDEKADEFEFPEPTEVIPPVFTYNIYRGFAKDAEPPGVYISRVMALQIGRAFLKCTHPARTAEVWIEVKKRWSPQVANDMADVETEIAENLGYGADFFRQIVSQELGKRF